MPGPEAGLAADLAAVEGLTPAAAIALQERARRAVLRRGPRRLPATVAGVDVSVRGGRVRSAVVVLETRRFEVVESARATSPATFPYVPGLLAFREVPIVLAAFERLGRRPGLLLVDGQGEAHPRRFGVACHLGVALDLPAIGVGKSRLVGEHREPGARRGCRTQLRLDDEVVGTVLRTRDGVRPVYVSVGHRVALRDAERFVLACARRFRLPEPIRRAHAHAALSRT